VYHNKDFVDASLIRSIFVPACDPLAPSAFLELSQAGKRTRFTMRGLLKQVSSPMMLLWGQHDPWMAPSKADAFMRLYPRVELVPIEGGHCPMDDDPVAVNANLLRFLELHE
jgi:pimeloyl-ACP methyl ester carboxylesterase